MQGQALIAANPHLKDPQKYRAQLIANVMSSTAIEIGQISEEIKDALLNYKINRDTSESPISDAREDDLE